MKMKQLSLPSLRLFALILVIGWSIFPVSAQNDGPVERWYPQIPGVSGLYRTTPASTWPISYDSEGHIITNVYGHTSFMVLSLAGLAAKACLEDRNSQLIEVDTQSYPISSQIAHQDLISKRGLQDLGTVTPWDLLDIFRDKGVVEGFVVYHYETGSRGLWNYTNPGPYDPSANVATVYAHQLNAVLIEQSMIPTAIAHGLKQLADCRGISQELCWSTYRNQINRDAIVACDPKVCWNRDYAVATGCFILFPLDPNDPIHASSFYRNTVLPDLTAPFPVLGWAGGDEYSGTYAATINGGFNTATSYDTNLLVYGCLAPGVDDPIDRYCLNHKAAFDPASLKWERGVHYTSFIMSDGDFYGLNNTYIEDALGSVGEYFGHPDRGMFSMTWSCAGADLLQTRPSSVRTLAELATGNDSFILMGGGYYYPDLFPTLLTHMQRISPLMETMGMRTWVGNFSDYDSTAARQAQAVIASTLKDMAGLFTIQYSPYTAGQGNIFWTPNSGGYDIPVISAKHAIWANSTFTGEGSPTAIAQSLGEAPLTGNSESGACFDWTIIHIWSFFKNCMNMNQSGAVFNPSQGIERCYASAKCCYEKLPDHVRVVSAEELAWQAALHLRTQDTLSRLLDQAEDDLTNVSPTGYDTVLIDDWRAILEDLPFTSEMENREAFLMVSDVLHSVRSATDSQVLKESFETFEPAALPQQGWMDLSGDSSVTTQYASTGEKSLHVGPSSSAGKQVYPGDSEAVVLENRVLLGALGEEDTTPPESPATAVLRFAKTGLLAFDGNGNGGGTWRQFSYDLTEGHWITVRIRLDYQSHHWSVLINDTELSGSLGFVDNSTRRLHGITYTGDQHLDDISLELKNSTQTKDWIQY